jgi:pyrrolidone-carboxylate peptidase
MSKLLCTGFIGNKNSSNVLLNNLSKNKNIDCLYVDNDFEISENQLKNKLKGNEYDIVFAFGQKPIIKSIYIEKIGSNGFEKLETNFNYMGLKLFLENYYRVKISENAGKYLCNNIYHKGLRYIFENKLKAKMVFIHIPYINNIDIRYFSKIINEYIMEII